MSHEVGLEDWTHETHNASYLVKVLMQANGLRGQGSQGQESVPPEEAGCNARAFTPQLGVLLL